MSRSNLTISALKDALKAVPHATVTKLEKSSHWVHIDDPNTVKKASEIF